MAKSEVEDKVATKPETKSKWKIPPVRIESDDCEVHVGRVIEDGEITEEGNAYHVHEGEWVELLPCRTLAEIMALDDLAKMARDSAAVVMDGPGFLRVLCQELSQRIVSWNWTGMDSMPLAQPHNAPTVLERLTDDELLWLLSAAQGGETSADRKNA